MSWFKQEQLETALKKGKIPVTDETVLNLDQWLFVMEHLYQLPSRLRWVPRTYKVLHTYNVSGGPSEELKNLGKALRSWLDADFETKKLEIQLLGGRVEMPRPEFVLECLSSLSKSISMAIEHLESVAKNTKEKEGAETSLFISIYQKYIELSGSKKLSDDGPGIRFIRECTAILGVATPEGLRRRIQQAIVSREGKPPPPPRDFSGLIEQIKFFFPETNNFAPVTDPPETPGSSAGS